jgi:hypothetical protein
VYPKPLDKPLAMHHQLPPPPSLPPAGRELAKFMASVQAAAYGSHESVLTSDMFR